MSSEFFALRSVSSWRLGCDYGSLKMLNYAEADQLNSASWDILPCEHSNSCSTRILPAVKLRRGKMGTLIWTRNGFFDLLFEKDFYNCFVQRFPSLQADFQIANAVRDDKSLLLYRICPNRVCKVVGPGAPLFCKECGLFLGQEEQSHGLVIEEESMDGALIGFCREIRGVIARQEVVDWLIGAKATPLVIWNIDDLPYDATLPLNVQRSNDVRRLVQRGRSIEEALHETRNLYGPFDYIDLQ